MLVVIYTPALDVLLLRRADAHDDANDNANANTEADAEEFWQSVTGSRDSLDEPFGDTAIREVAAILGDSLIRLLTTSVTENRVDLPETESVHVTAG